MQPVQGDTTPEKAARAFLLCAKTAVAAWLFGL